MTDWYKMNPVDWNEGTDDLTLEQEGAYLRICNAIYISERPIRNNMFVVAGLLRCSDRKAKRLVDDLVKAGKLFIEAGMIVNRRAVDELSTRARLRVDRQSSGSRGGVKSAEGRAKSLENKGTAEAYASSKIEPDKKRIEESIDPKTPFPAKTANPIIILQSILGPISSQRWASHCEQKGRRLSVPQAEAQVAVLAGIRNLGSNPDKAVQFAIEKGWVSLSLEYFHNAGFFGPSAPSKPLAEQVADWSRRMQVFREDGTWTHAWGPKPGEPGCRVPPELLKQVA